MEGLSEGEERRGEERQWMMSVVSRRAAEPFVQRASQSTSQPISQSASQPVSQSASQPISQSAIRLRSSTVPGQVPSAHFKGSDTDGETSAAHPRRVAGPGRNWRGTGTGLDRNLSHQQLAMPLVTVSAIASSPIQALSSCLLWSTALQPTQKSKLPHRPHKQEARGKRQERKQRKQRRQRKQVSRQAGQAIFRPNTLLLLISHAFICSSIPLHPIRTSNHRYSTPYCSPSLDYSLSPLFCPCASHQEQSDFPRNPDRRDPPNGESRR